MFRIKEIDVVELKKRTENNFSFTLLDVREPHEVEFAKIEPHVHIPMETLPVRHEEMDKGTPTCCYVSYWRAIGASMPIFRTVRIQCDKLKRGN